MVRVCRSDANAAAAMDIKDRVPEAMSKEDLKNLLRNLGCPVSGNRLRADLENDLDYEEQFDDNVQHFVWTGTEQFRGECPHIQDENSEFDFLNVMWASITANNKKHSYLAVLNLTRFATKQLLPTDFLF